MNSLYWVRTDLRLIDNEALSDFCKQSKAGLMIWCESQSTKRAGPFRRQFINQSLNEFRQSLTAFQQDLQVSDNLAEFAIPEILKKHKFDALFYQKAFFFEDVEVEQKIKRVCRELGVQVFESPGSTLILQSDLPFAIHDMPFIFTQFRQQIEKSLAVKALLPSPQKMPMQFLPLTQASIINQDSPRSLFQGGEVAALNRLREFIWSSHSIKTYKDTRNGMLQFNDSSKLSPWLNQGALSARQIYHEVKRYELEVISNSSTYWMIFELLWRDYFKFFSVAWGAKILENEFLQNLNNASNDSEQSSLENWINAQTQSSFVNANMIEIGATGWMSNRGRQNVASYLIHDLQVSWEKGAQYFEKMLIDYDPDLNWGNWLYLSGKGSDPRSRKFNVEKQARQYDPEGLYEKKWLTSPQKGKMP